VTSNQLWNTHYSDYQTYLYNRITELKQEGLGYRKIAKLLNAEGVRAARNKEFLPASVHSILKKKKIRETRINREFNIDPTGVSEMRPLLCYRDIDEHS
tara:strand:- start:82 stop:378 length:297 start_codon:yes stop_codon:yes gene_type:complete